MIDAESYLIMYVYYKIHTDTHQRYLSATNALNNSIGASYPNLKMSRQRRPELDAENRELWMEIYHGIPHAKLEKFTADLNKLVEINNMTKERRYEVFIAL